jgi:hypothetical protein
MSDDEERTKDDVGTESGVGGENTENPEDEGQPLGPATPDSRRALGDTPEAHDEIIPQDLPKDHPGRQEAERQAAEGDGTVRGNT